MTNNLFENKIGNALQILKTDELTYLETMHGDNGQANRYRVKFPGASSIELIIFDNDGQNYEFNTALAIARSLIIQRAIAILEVKTE